MKRGSTSWSEDEFRLAKRMITKEACSYGEVKLVLPGRSRSMIAGLANRQGWKRGGTKPEATTVPIRPHSYEFPPFKKGPLPPPKPTKLEPEWQCCTPGCAKTRARPYLHCRECKAAKIQTAP